MSQEQAEAVLCGLAPGDLSGCVFRFTERLLEYSLIDTPVCFPVTLGYLYQHDEIRLRQVAYTVNPDSHPSIIAAVYLVKLALDGIPVNEYARRMMDFTEGLSDELDRAILRVGHVMGWVSEKAALAHIAPQGTEAETVATALYCVMRSPDDYAACMHRAPDHVASIVGAVMGARLGLDAIPAEQRKSHRHFKHLARRMAQARENSLET
jgi:hypothetical protein